jgi:asparagine synthase (glutamine-hydrolysing)
MCGIAGAIGLEPDAIPDPAIVSAMSRCIAHRGPDGEGVWVSPSGRACLAHRRLSVIDPALGSQPMVARGGRSGIVFNGEIYNYVELREALQREGETFDTHSDTEVLLRLLGREGEACLDRLRGMFAFVWWDDASGRLIVARDRIGKKPLYWRLWNRCLWFASSLRALRSALSGPWDMDHGALDDYLTLGYVPAPATIYRETRKLPSATVMTLTPSGLDERRFWDLGPEQEPFTGSYAAALDRLDELLGTAVSIRLRSDVPLGIFLSGGIDSSLVASCAARASLTPVETFSVGFDEAGLDESAHARAVAREIGTSHHEIRARENLLDLIPEVVSHFGEPFGDSSALPTWVLSRLARTRVTVALGGDGGDESFAGYNWYGNAARVNDLAGRIPAPARSALARAASTAAALAPLPALQRTARGLAVLDLPGEDKRFAALRSFLSPSDTQALYRGALAARVGSGRTGPALVREHYSAAEGSVLRRMRWADIRTYLADDLMPKVDVASMAHGLEVRAPLLDQEVVRFGLSLPQAYLRDARGGKRILRDLLARHVPPTLFERPKQGFSVPLASWFRGPLRDRLSGAIASGRLSETGLLDPAAMSAMLAEHASGRRDHGERLYHLLILDEWLGQAG